MRKLLVLLGFLAACAFDVACPRHADAAALEASPTAAGWHITFDSRADQILVIVVTECIGKVNFYVYDEVPLYGDETEVTAKRQRTPRGVNCRVLITLMVAVERGSEVAEGPLILAQVTR